MQKPARYQEDVLMFFSARPACLPLYEALEAVLEAEFPAASVRVQKSQISFYGRHLFAMASLPRRKKDEGILLSLGLGRPLTSPRVAYQSEPYPGRFTIHIPLKSAGELDAELLAWLREAWEFNETK